MEGLAVLFTIFTIYSFIDTVSRGVLNEYKLKHKLSVVAIAVCLLTL